jgi:hypothetical protein
MEMKRFQQTTHRIYFLQKTTHELLNPMKRELHLAAAQRDEAARVFR